jgi:hypothetical protein
MLRPCPNPPSSPILHGLPSAGERIMRRVLLFGLLAVALGLNGAGAQVYPDKTI